MCVDASLMNSQVYVCSHGGLPWPFLYVHIHILHTTLSGNTRLLRLQQHGKPAVFLPTRFGFTAVLQACAHDDALREELIACNVRVKEHGNYGCPPEAFWVWGAQVLNGAL